MALYAFDGTWNTKKDKEDETHHNTNVVKLHAAYEKASGEKQYYVEGVGTRWDMIGAALGGVFGLGERPRLNEAYTRVCENWAAPGGGDRLIDIIGFSRGSATALDFLAESRRRASASQTPIKCPCRQGRYQRAARAVSDRRASVPNAGDFPDFRFVSAHGLKRRFVVFGSTHTMVPDGIVGPKASAALDAATAASS